MSQISSGYVKRTFQNTWNNVTAKILKERRRVQANFYWKSLQLSHTGGRIKMRRFVCSVLTFHYFYWLQYSPGFLEINIYLLVFLFVYEEKIRITKPMNNTILRIYISKGKSYRCIFYSCYILTTNVETSCWNSSSRQTTLK